MIVYYHCYYRDKNYDIDDQRMTGLSLMIPHKFYYYLHKQLFFQD